MCFKDVYRLLQKDFNLPKLTAEPEIITYSDGTFAINWWPHIIFRADVPETANHKQYTIDNEEEEDH